MKFLLSSKRTKALLGIGLTAIGIGAISKKVISYPTGGCMKSTQELTINKGIKNKIFLTSELSTYSIIIVPPIPKGAYKY